jgi:protein arginine kinase activator
MNVVCQVCKTRPAKVHYTEIVNNNMVSLDLCAECAEEKGIDVQAGTPYGIGDLVAGLIDSAVAGEMDKIGRVHCASCGYDYSDFKKIGRFGCPDCYASFEAQIAPMLRQIHGAVQHQGKAPPDHAKRTVVRERVTALRDDLAQAIAAEDYERAAVIRDEIRQLEGKPVEES